VAEAHAQSVQALLDAGAQLVGKTVSDELAFSLSGTNVHYGTPVNPVAPDRIPGGSSSGSASAVASGLVDFALGTDTGGSTRVPASYCGIYGLRATHGRISSEGVFLLAPSFCTIGIFTRDAATLGRAWRALRVGALVGFPVASDRVPRELLVVPELRALADPSAAAAFDLATRQLAAGWELEIRVASFAEVGDPGEIFSTFRTIQMYEAWQLHGAWVERHHDALGWGIAARFDAASGVDADALSAAVERRAVFQQRFNEFLGDGAYLLQPATSGVAPLISLRGTEKDDLRLRTMTLTAPAGLAGAPVVALPVAMSDGLPIGVACVGRPGDDDALTRLAADGSQPAS
jgi:Asp-tRNA(Asn)/Glu-tRNA(Gln) amidotransferase A subunit family amidase